MHLVDTALNPTGVDGDGPGAIERTNVLHGLNPQTYPIGGS